MPRTNTDTEEEQPQSGRPADYLSTNDRKLAGLLTFMGWTSKLTDATDRGLVQSAVYLLQHCGLGTTYKFDCSVVGPYSKPVYDAMTKLSGNHKLMAKGLNLTKKAKENARLLLSLHNDHPDLYVVESAGVVYYTMLEHDIEFDRAVRFLDSTGLRAYIESTSVVDELLGRLDLIEEE